MEHSPRHGPVNNVVEGVQIDATERADGSVTVVSR